MMLVQEVGGRLAYRRIQMWAHPLRKAKKANKAKIPYENHVKPFRKS